MKRLNSQHGLVRELMGDTIVHSFVPIDQVESVADMATGTGCVYIYISILQVKRKENLTR